jgi:hypothetical protein
MKTNMHLRSHLAQFFLDCEMFQTKVVVEIKPHILCSVTFSRKSSPLWDNVGGKNDAAEQATDDNMAHVHCMLDN